MSGVGGRESVAARPRHKDGENTCQKCLTQTTVHSLGCCGNFISMLYYHLLAFSPPSSCWTPLQMSSNRSQATREWSSISRLNVSHDRSARMGTCTLSIHACARGKEICQAMCFPLKHTLVKLRLIIHQSASMISGSLSGMEGIPIQGMLMLFQKMSILQAGFAVLTHTPRPMQL